MIKREGRTWERVCDTCGKSIATTVIREEGEAKVYFSFVAYKLPQDLCIRCAWVRFMQD